MAQVVLDRPRILAIIGELVPAAMPQHVAGNQEQEFSPPPRRAPPSEFESIWRRWLAWAKLYAAFRSAALPVGGSRRVATEVDSSIFAEGFCFLAAPKRGERPHQRQSEPNFSLRLLVSQLSSSPAFLCKPLEHARHVHREKPVSMDFRRPNIS